MNIKEVKGSQKSWIKNKGVHVGLSILAVGGLAGCAPQTIEKTVTITPAPKTIEKTVIAPTPTIIVNIPPEKTVTVTPTVRAPEAKPNIPTPTPNATINADLPPRSFGPGEVTYAGPNNIIVGDVVINGIRMFDDREETGLIVDMRVNASVSLPYGGSEITISDPIKKAAEIEKQRQMMSLSGKRGDVIIFDGGPNQQTQGYPQIDWNNPNWNNWNNPDWNNWNNWNNEIQRNYNVPIPREVMPNQVVNVGPYDFFMGDAIVTKDGNAWYMYDNDQRTGLIIDFQVYAQIAPPWGGRLVSARNLADKQRLIQEARDAMYRYGGVNWNGLNRVDVLPFTGGSYQVTQRGY